MTEKMSRWGGVAAMLGGLLFAGAGSAMNLRPAGVPGGPHRQTDDLGLVMLVGGLLILPAIAALRAQLTGRTRPLGTAVLVLTVLGFVVGLLAMLGELAGQDVPWPLPVAGLLGLWLGSLLIGLAVLTQDVVSRGVAALLVVGTLVLLLFNTEDTRSLMALPFGLAWMAMGYQLWSGPERRLTTPVNPARAT